MAWVNRKGPIYPWLILLNVTLATIIGTLSATAGFVVNSNIRGTLMLSSDDLQWITISFIMMLGTILPLAVWLADQYGYKKVFLIGIAVFVFGSLLDGFASNFWTFMGSRMIAGMGAGALFPLSVAIIDQTFPKTKLPFAMSLYIGLGFGFGTVAGVMVGGYFAQYFTWESVFYLCFLLGIPILFVTWFLHEESPRSSPKKFDFIGYFCFILAIAAIFIVLVSGKAGWNAEGWTSPFVIAWEVIGVLSLTALIWYEWKCSHPLITLSLFKTRSYLLGCLSLFFVGAVLYFAQLSSAEFLDLDLHYQKAQIGNYLVIQGLVMGIGSSLIAFLTRKVSVRTLTLAGMAVLTVSCFLNSSLTIYSSHEQFLLLNFLRWSGIALAVGPATAYALKETPITLAGPAAVFIIVARQIGGTISTVACGDIVIERTIFHAERFGAQIATESSRFQQVAYNLQSHIMQVTGADVIQAKAKAIALIQSNVARQAHATAIADAFWILGILVGVSTLLLFAEAVWSSKKKSLDSNLASDRK
jgi:DHA2 family multidrug resistance protein